MAEERRPLSPDIWNRPWPPKHMKGEPLQPWKPPEPAPRPDLGPLPPPTRENWLALILGTVSLALATVDVGMDEWGWTGLPFLPYLAAVAIGAFRVRPRAGRGRAFFLWFLPILLQLSIYALLFGEVVSSTLTGLFRQRLDAYRMAASAAFLSGWIPAVGLGLMARRGRVLLAAQIAGPLLVAFAMWLIFVSLDVN